MTEIIETGESEPTEIETETAEITIEETPAATVVVVEETPPAETGATMSQLVDTISALNTTIIDLRMQIETERVNDMSALFEVIGNLKTKVDDPITEPSGKERGRRWL